jgi:chemotaxis-related protein WspD
MRQIELFNKESDEKQERDSTSIAADVLLSRAPPKDYISEWTHLLKQQKPEEKDEQSTSVMIFRLNAEWFAMPTKIFRLVTEIRPIHHLPHRITPTVQGIVNIRGQARLCVSLKYIFGIDTEQNKESYSRFSYPRMLMMEKDGVFFVFEVDEVFGIFICDENRVENVPVNVTKSSTNYLKGIFKWENKSVGYIDQELLFYSLQRSMG